MRYVISKTGYVNYQPINQPTNQNIMKKILHGSFGESVRKLWGGVNI